MATTPAAPTSAFQVIEKRLDVSFATPGAVNCATFQPFIELHRTADPIALTAVSSTRQVTLIKTIIEQVEAGTLPSEFIIWPECAIPHGMVDEVASSIASERWPRNSILVSGVEHIGVEDAKRIIAASSDPNLPGLAGWRNEQFVNLCLIWAKQSDGTLALFVQPKLSLSAPEQASQAMAIGSHVYLFSCSGMSFCCLVCFDAIAQVEGTTPIADRLLESVNGLSQGQPPRRVPIDLIVIPQLNPSPEHAEFLTFPSRIVTSTYGNVDCERAAIVFANCGAKESGRSLGGLGRSSFYYALNTWQPVAASGPLGPATYSVESIEGHPSIMRARFREDGPSVHAFTFYVPKLTNRSVNGVRFPLHDARTALIRDTSIDQFEAKTPYKKVMTDWAIDHVLSGPLLRCDHQTLDSPVRDHYRELCADLKRADEIRITQIADTLFAGVDPPNKTPKINPDHWQRHPMNWFEENKYGQALVHMLSTLVPLAFLERLSFQTCEMLTAKNSRLGIAILDGSDAKPHSALLSAFRNHASGLASCRERRILILLSRVTRAPDLIQPEELVGMNEISGREEGSFQAELLQDQNDISVAPSTRVYWHKATAVRHTLSTATIEIARAALEALLQPCLN